MPRVAESYFPRSILRDSSPDASTVKTLTCLADVNAVFITVETTAARVTFDGSTPSTTNGIVIQKDSSPLFVPVVAGTQIKWISTAGAASVLVAHQFE